MVFQFPVRKPLPKEGGCEVKVKRDKSGRVIGIKTNGKCTKQEIELFRENIHAEHEIEED